MKQRWDLTSNLFKQLTNTKQEGILPETCISECREGRSQTT